MNRDDWRVKKRYEREFLGDLKAILQRYFRGEGEQVRLLSTPDWLDLYAQQAARRMITGLYVANARTWQAASLESMRGRLIYAALQEELAGPVGERVRQLVAENAKLIRSMPLRIAQQVTEMAARRQQSGERAVSAEQFIPRVAAWHARLIARTETSKASTALTQARAENLGFKWFVWRTSLDERVRKSHRLMEDVLVQWTDLPSPEELAGERSYGRYAAGNVFNCRCYCEMVLRLSLLRWPHKIYMNGRIQQTTLAAFRRIANLDQAIAA